MTVKSGGKDDQLLSSKELDDEIATLQDRLETLTQRRKQLKNEKPIQKLARWLHGKFCPHNHVDQCAWDYENSWNGATKSGWLHKAKLTIKVIEEFYDISD